MASIETRVTIITVAWFSGLVAAAVLAPFVGGLAVIAMTRIPPLRAGSPRGRTMLTVWTAISVVQLVGLFLAVGVSTSTDVVLP